MTYLEAQCDLWWRKCVIEKARGHCVFCGGMQIECHHIFYGADKSIKRMRYDPDFGVCLCGRDHRTDPTAPHVNNSLFLTRLKEILLKTDHDRWYKIEKYLVKPHRKDLIPIDLKMVLGSLKSQYKEIKKVSWVDDYIDIPPNGNWQGS